MSPLTVLEQETYCGISEILRKFVNDTNYPNIHSRLCEESVSETERQIMEYTANCPPQTVIRTSLDILRNEFDLDYDDLVIEGGWMEHLPKMIARNYILRHFLELGNGLEGNEEHFHDATLNNAADDYTGFIDLIVIKIQTMGERTHYSFNEEDIEKTKAYVEAIMVLMEYCRDMLDMSSTLRPTLFQMRNRRMEGRIRSVIEMSTFRKDCPGIRKLLERLGKMVREINNDRALWDLQAARNERYKQSKIRLYRYTIRCLEDLNNQLEACDIYDFTRRADLRKQLEQVQIFQKSFDKDR